MLIISPQTGPDPPFIVCRCHGRSGGNVNGVIQALESPGELKMNGGLVAQGGDTAKAAFGVHEFAGHGNADNLRMDSAVGAENMASDRAVEILSKDEELLVKPRIER
jgi:hypothetical protein